MSGVISETIVYEDEVMRVIKKTGIISPPPPPPPGNLLDLNGIPIMSTPKLNGRNWYLKPDSLGSLGSRDSNYCFNPSGDIQLRIECGTASVVNFGTTTNTNGSTTTTTKKLLRMTGRPDNGRCSIHMASHQRGDEDEANVKYTWNSGAADKHYMEYLDDIVSAEYTLIYKLNGILDMNNEVSWILGGAGHHTTDSPYNNQASCYNSHFKYLGSSGTNAFSVEFNHGTYNRTSVTPQTTYGSMESKYFGVKVCGFADPTKWDARYVVTYVNEDPIDLITGIPKTTGWRKYTEWKQTTYEGGFHPHVWGGVNDKMRNDKIKGMDLLYASRIEITALPKA